MLLANPNGLGARGVAGAGKCRTRRRSQGGADRATNAPSRRRTRTTHAVAEGALSHLENPDQRIIAVSPKVAVLPDIYIPLLHLFGASADVLLKVD